MKHKYDDTMMGLFAEVFCAMPLCATIDEKVFVVHGGLATQDDVTLDDIQKARLFPSIVLMSGWLTD